MSDKPKKKIDWMEWKRKCPKCNSVNLKLINEYRRVYQDKNDKYMLKELQKVKCMDCGGEFWI